jgi:hypothetical protein
LHKVEKLRLDPIRSSLLDKAARLARGKKMKQTPPQEMDLASLAAVLEREPAVKIILAQATKWITWESALTLQIREVFILRVRPDEPLPIYVSMSEDINEAESIPYDKEMKFILRVE